MRVIESYILDFTDQLTENGNYSYFIVLSYYIFFFIIIKL